MVDMAIYAIAVTLLLVALLTVLYYELQIKAQPKLRRYIPEEYRRYILWRDEGKCRKCNSTDDLTVDHIMPVVRGGTNELANLQLLCRSCNSSKGARI